MRAVKRAMGVWAKEARTLYCLVHLKIPRPKCSPMFVKSPPSNEHAASYHVFRHVCRSFALRRQTTAAVVTPYFRVTPPFHHNAFVAMPRNVAAGCGLFWSVAVLHPLICSVDDPIDTTQLLADSLSGAMCLLLPALTWPL